MGGALYFLVVVAKLFLEMSYVPLSNICHNVLGRFDSEGIFFILELDPITTLASAQLVIFQNKEVAYIIKVLTEVYDSIFPHDAHFLPRNAFASRFPKI
jgi:hypothetical protein